MSEYDIAQAHKFWYWFGSYLSAGIILAFIVMGMTKLGSSWFNISDQYRGATYQEIQALKQCAKVHGTPVLENDGSAYKSCAINGKSDTLNVVR